MHIEDTQRLVTEIEMLKIMLYLMVYIEENSSSPKSTKIIRLRDGFDCECCY
jgi:hypothetical protein